MKSRNNPSFLNAPGVQQASNEEQPCSQLSYSLMAKQIDDQQGQSQLQMLNQNPSNIVHSHKNTPNEVQSNLQVQKFKPFGSHHPLTKFPTPTSQELKKNPITIVTPKDGQRLKSVDPYAINVKLQPKNQESTFATRQGFSQNKNGLLGKPIQNRNCKQINLGQKIVNSRIINPTNKYGEALGQVDQESVVLPSNDQDESIPHFKAASFDTSEQSQAKQFQQQPSNQNKILITITKSKVNKNQKNIQRDSINSPLSSKQRIQFNPSHQTESLQLIKNNQQKKQIQVYMQKEQETANFKKQASGSINKGTKLTNSRVYNSPAVIKEIPTQAQKIETSEKRVVKIEVSNNRMKSTYDPMSKKTEFKLATGGNLSQPGKRQSKIIEQKQEIQFLDESQSEALKGKSPQKNDQVQLNNKAKNENISTAIMMKLQTITKQIAKSHEMLPLTLRKEQLVDNSYRKPSKHKIEIMKNLAPEELFNGFSSVQINQKEKRQQSNKVKHPQYSSFIVQQIETLKKKIKELEKVATKKQFSREQIKLQRVNSDKNNFSTNKRISINYKDYNQTSLAKVIKKKSSSIIKRDISSQISYSQDEFVELEVLMSLFKKLPKPEHTPEVLADLSMQVFQKLGINPDQHGYMDLTRFKQGVQFELNDGPALIWCYDGQMYLGQTVVRRQGILQMEGEGVLIEPNATCYKGRFSKGKKSGFGIYLNAKGEKYKGQWKNDVFHGKGRLQSDMNVYEGYFQKGLKQGEGVEMFRNGDTYEGEYEDDKFHGKGRYCWKNKTVYVGEFKIGFMEGEGLWKSKKDSYQGQYYRNMKHGYGIYRWGNGRIYEGKFEHGHRISKNNSKKPTIAVEKEITYDMEMQSQSQSEIYEAKMNQNGLKTLGRRFTIQSREQSPRQRKRGSKFNLIKR